MFKVEVIADNSGQWCGNGLTFDTVEKATDYAQDLFNRWTAVYRWTAVRSWRVVDSTGAVHNQGGITA